MASLGQLTAGIAHEINNPVNFITANIFPLRRNIEDLIQLLHAYRQAQSPQQVATAEALARQLDLPLLQQETSELLHGLQEGADRTAEIVSGLRIFARLDEDDLKTFDLHTGLDATLSLLKNRLTGIEVLRDYGTLPPIAGFPGKINQVFMNVLTNAIQAMPQGGIIYLQTQQDGEEAVIRIRDTGVGMNEMTRSRAFEPFFTTKDVGEGTGLGLSISLGIVTQHQGTITLQSLEGQGTEVEIRLPIG
jgi:signal transduction histidine kinase